MTTTGNRKAGVLERKELDQLLERMDVFLVLLFPPVSVLEEEVKLETVELQDMEGSVARQVNLVQQDHQGEEERKDMQVTMV